METLGFTLLYLGFGAILMVALERGHTGPRAAPGLDRAGDRADHGAPFSFTSGARSVAVIVRRALASTLAWIGVYSYSIYLWHLAVKRWVAPAIERTLGWPEVGIVAMLVYMAASLAAGVAMARLIEIPTLALRDRWLPSVATPRASDAQRGNDLAA